MNTKNDLNFDLDVYVKIVLSPDNIVLYGYIAEIYYISHSAAVIVNINGIPRIFDADDVKKVYKKDEYPEYYI